MIPPSPSHDAVSPEYISHGKNRVHLKALRHQRTHRIGMRKAVLRHFALRERRAWKCFACCIVLFVSICSLMHSQESRYSQKGKNTQSSSEISDSMEVLRLPPIISQEQVENEQAEQKEILELAPITPPPFAAPINLIASIEPAHIEIPQEILDSPLSAEELQKTHEIPELFPEELSLRQEPVKQAPMKKAQRRKQLAAASSASNAATIVQVSYKSAPSPPYPQRMRARNISGTVRVCIKIDKNGNPKLVSILNSSGYQELDNQARIWILEHWLFNPAMKNGIAHHSVVTTNINFVQT